MKCQKINNIISIKIVPDAFKRFRYYFMVYIEIRIKISIDTNAKDYSLSEIAPHS